MKNPEENNKDMASFFDISDFYDANPKYARIFKRAVLLNPVVNIPFMHGISDILER